MLQKCQRGDISTHWIGMETRINRIQRWETDLIILKKEVKNREVGRKDEPEGTGGFSVLPSVKLKSQMRHHSDKMPVLLW